jgi:NIPSNAP
MLVAVPPLFRIHGIRTVDHWTVLAGPKAPSFVYVIAWKDAAEREAGWASFYADERWWRIRAETNDGVELVESYALLLLRPNRRWAAPFLTADVRSPGAVQDMALCDVAIGRNAEVADHLFDELLPIFTRAGAELLAVLDTVAGPVVPSIAFWLAWPDYAARAAGWGAYHAAKTLRAASEAQSARFGRPPIGRSDVYLLEPAGDAPASA